MKSSIKSFIILLTLFVLVGCTKDNQNQPESGCDLNDFTGSWSFILNGDPSTEYIGQIDKYNDTTLNVTFQPSTEYDYFLQTVVLDCENGSIFQFLPAGNHGTKTIEGSITSTDFVYQDSTHINYTGTPQITVKRIVGIKQ